MKVKEAIKLLKEQDPEAELIITSSNFELKNSMVSAKHIVGFNHGMEREVEFKDSFDQSGYKKPVWNLFVGSENVVFIDG